MFFHNTAIMSESKDNDVSTAIFTFSRCNEGRIDC